MKAIVFSLVGKLQDPKRNTRMNLKSRKSQRMIID